MWDQRGFPSHSLICFHCHRLFAWSKKGIQILDQLCMYVCMYVCMCVVVAYVYVHVGKKHLVYVRMHRTCEPWPICMYVCMYICMYVCMDVLLTNILCMYCKNVLDVWVLSWGSCVCSMLCMYVRTYVCMYVCMYVCTCVHTYME
jgi:hypothetical protein